MRPQTADKVVRVESSQSSIQRIVVRCARTLKDTNSIGIEGEISRGDIKKALALAMSALCRVLRSMSAEYHSVITFTLVTFRGKLFFACPVFRNPKDMGIYMIEMKLGLCRLYSLCVVTSVVENRGIRQLMMFRCVRRFTALHS